VITAEVSPGPGSPPGSTGRTPGPFSRVGGPCTGSTPIRYSSVTN